MKDIDFMIKELTTLKNYDQFGFYSQFVLFIEGTKQMGFDSFVTLIRHFWDEIERRHYFYMSSINETLFFFYIEEVDLGRIINLLDSLIPFATQQSLDFIAYILKRQGKGNTEVVSHLTQTKRKIYQALKKIRAQSSEEMNLEIKGIIAKWYD